MKYPDIASLLMRITFGGLMLTHGWPKMEKLLAWGEIRFADPIGIGPTASLILTVIAEVLCALLVVLGIKTRITVIPLIIVMAIAAFVVHAGDPLGDREMAFIYLAGYLVISMLGSGKYSLDYVLFKKK